MLAVRAVIVAALLVSLVVPVARAADEPDELMPGRIVIIKNAKLAKFVARPPAGRTFDLPDATNAPTSEGGQLEVFDDDTFRPVRAAHLALPSSGWTGLGNPAGSEGYKYKGAGSPTDPCRIVIVKANIVKANIVKAVCTGTGVTLPTPFTGQVGIVLTVGTDSKRYCAAFGGQIVHNVDSVLKRRDAPPPDFCPLDLNSSTTIPPTSSSTTSTTSTTTTTLGFSCAETSGSCSGDCGPGMVCATMFGCQCVPVGSCADTFPACGGPCPPASVCASGTTNCFCVEDPTSCEAEVCGGACSPGRTCVDINGTCGCTADDRAGCAASTAPACAATCPSGEACRDIGGTCHCAAEGPARHTCSCTDLTETAYCAPCFTLPVELCEEFCIPHGGWSEATSSCLPCP